MGALSVHHGALVVHQCLPVNGVSGWLGVQLALLRPDSDCPSGALAVGGDPHHAVGVIAMVALPVLLAHVVGAGGWLGLAAMLRALIAGTVALLRAVTPALPAGGEIVWSWRALPVATIAFEALDRLAAGCLWRRGPPILHAV